MPPSGSPLCALYPRDPTKARRARERNEAEHEECERVVQQASRSSSLASSSSSPSSSPSSPLHPELEHHVYKPFDEIRFLGAYILEWLVAFVYEDPLPPLKEGNKRPVVLVPGWIGKTRTWSRMAERFNAEGHPVYTVPLGTQLGCIKKKASRLSNFLDHHGLDDVYVVAHSMGGLITCTAMMEGETRIRKVWTLGTPYRGTYVVYLSYFIFILLSLLVCATWRTPLGLLLALAIFSVPSLQQMSPLSSFLRAFHERMSTLLDQGKVQCIYARKDQIVISSHRDIWSPPALGHHDDIEVPEYGHMNLFIGLSGIHLVLSLVREAEAKSQSQSAVQGDGVSVGGRVQQ